MQLRFSVWHQLLLLFKRPLKLGEMLGAIAVFAVSFRLGGLLYLSSGAMLDPNLSLPFALRLLGFLMIIGPAQLVYWLFVIHGIRGERDPTLADLPERLWVLVEIETGRIPMADDGIHAVVFQHENQALPWVARYQGSMNAECVESDRTLGVFRGCGVKSLVYYHGPGENHWVVLSLSGAA